MFAKPGPKPTPKQPRAPRAASPRKFRVEPHGSPREQAVDRYTDHPRAWNESNSARPADLAQPSATTTASVDEPTTTALESELSRRGDPLPSSFRDWAHHLDLGDSDVSVHTGQTSRALASRFGCRAFTVGHDIFMPDAGGLASAMGTRVLRHELAHVAQNHGMPVGGPSLINRSPPDMATATDMVANFAAVTEAEKIREMDESGIDQYVKDVKAKFEAEADAIAYLERILKVFNASKLDPATVKKVLHFRELILQLKDPRREPSKPPTAPPDAKKSTKAADKAIAMVSLSAEERASIPPDFVTEFRAESSEKARRNLAKEYMSKHPISNSAMAKAIMEIELDELKETPQSWFSKIDGSATFLGVPIKQSKNSGIDGAHEDLVTRLAIAEQKIADRMKCGDPVACGQKLDIDRVSCVRPPSIPSGGGGLPSMHSYGLAVDIDVVKNPDLEKTAESTAVKNALRLIYGKETKLFESKSAGKYTVEQIWYMIDEASDALKEYLALDPDSKDPEVVKKFHDAVKTYGGGEEKTWRDNLANDRRNAKKVVKAVETYGGLSSLSLDFVKAMDEAELFWVARQNRVDIQHFDDRRAGKFKGRRALS